MNYKLLIVLVLLIFISGCYGERISTKSSHYYYKNDEVNYYRGFHSYPIKNVDKDTFEVLSQTHAKDKNYVYIQAEVLEGVDVKSFEVLRDYINLQGIQFRPHYLAGIVKDKNNVYVGTHKIENVSPENLELLDNYFLKNDQYVYSLRKNTYELKFVEGADLDSFKVFNNSGFARDNETLFMCNESLKGNPDTFRQIDEYFVIIDNELYFFSTDYDICEELQRLHFGDVDTFQHLSGRYYKDKNNVYLAGLYLEYVDSKDPDSFELLKYDYAKDKYHVFRGGKVIEGADPETFKVLNKKCGKDTDWLYTWNLKYENTFSNRAKCR